MKNRIIHRGLTQNNENPNESEWVTGSLIFNDKNEQYYIVEFTDGGNPVFNMIKQESIGLTTGIADLNGATVFERDIIKDEDNRYHVVIDDHGVLGVTPLEVYNANLWMYNTNWVTRQGGDIIKHSTVIGNLVENTSTDLEVA